MKKTRIFLFSALAFAAFGMQSCLDFDEPGEEFEKTTVVDNVVISKGVADSINYLKEISDEDFDKAMSHLTTGTDRFYQALTGIYGMRGGKEGGMPQAHSYQRQYSLGPDNYAQFFTVPHSDFMYGTLVSTYAISKEFNNNPFGCYRDYVKSSIVPILNNGSLDTIPEMKALYLLMYDYSSIEVADLSGPLPYTDYKNNRTASPFVYDDVQTIYYTVEANIDTIVNCLRHFPQRSEYYRQNVIGNMYSYMPMAKFTYEETDLEMWARFANSLKLRMAIHMANVEPETAKKWAEEAVASGVIETTEQEVGLFISYLGCDHPLITISQWGDTRLSASFESLLFSLDHPYSKYLFAKNSDPIAKVGTHGSAPASTPAGTRVVGMREGTVPGLGQSVGSNTYIAFSQVDNSKLASIMPPLYLMKLSEVCFLRAEGALRGWNMGGTAKQFYEEGIRYAGLEDRQYLGSSEYDKYLDDYMERTEPVDYTWVDPTGNDDDVPSVTKIGVKWDDGLDQETKLEMIITQKYIASFPYSYEPWVDMRRTGYPKMFPVLNPSDGDGSLKDGDLIRRIVWSSDDPQTQQDLEETGIPALGGDDLQGTRLWWDIDGSNF